MRASLLKRGKPLRRKTWMRSRKGNTSYSRRERNVDYMLAVKSLPCVAHDLGGCYGEVQADHAGRRGLGQKCHDRDVISICRQHHQQRGDFSGPFRTWKQADMRAWLTSMVEVTQQRAAAKGILIP